MNRKETARDCMQEMIWKTSHQLLSSPHPISFTLKCWALSYLAVLGLQLNQMLEPQLKYLQCV